MSTFVNTKTMVLISALLASFVGPMTPTMAKSSKSYEGTQPLSLENDEIAHFDEASLKSALKKNRPGKISVRLKQGGWFKRDTVSKIDLAQYGFYLDEQGNVRLRQFATRNPSDQKVTGLSIGFTGITAVEFASYTPPSALPAPAMEPSESGDGVAASGSGPRHSSTTTTTTTYSNPQDTVLFTFDPSSTTTSTRNFRKYLTERGFSKDRDGYVVFNGQRIVDENGNFIKFDDLIERLKMSKKSGIKFALYSDPNNGGRTVFRTVTVRRAPGTTESDGDLADGSGTADDATGSATSTTPRYSSVTVINAQGVAGNGRSIGRRQPLRRDGTRGPVGASTIHTETHTVTEAIDPMKVILDKLSNYDGYRKGDDGKSIVDSKGNTVIIVDADGKPLTYDQLVALLKNGGEIKTYQNRADGPNGRAGSVYIQVIRSLSPGGGAGASSGGTPGDSTPVTSTTVTVSEAPQEFTTGSGKYTKHYVRAYVNGGWEILTKHADETWSDSLGNKYKKQADGKWMISLKGSTTWIVFGSVVLPPNGSVSGDTSGAKRVIANLSAYIVSNPGDGSDRVIRVSPPEAINEGHPLYKRTIEAGNLDDLPVADNFFEPMNQLQPVLPADPGAVK